MLLSSVQEWLLGCFWLFSSCFYVKICGNLSVVNTLTLKQIFLKTKTISKNWSTVFQLKALTLQTHHFRTKLPYHKPMLRQIECWVQNRPITKNWVLPVITVWKFCFNLRTSYKELIQCTNYPMPIVVFKHFLKMWQIFIKASQLMTFVNCLVLDLQTI